MKKVLFVSLLLILAACQGNASTLKDAPTADAGPVTQIDFPAAGAVLPFGDVVIQAHADDPLGVTRAEVSINNAVLAQVDSLHLGGDTAHFEYIWHPEAAGQFTLVVRAQNSAGTWGSPASLAFSITEPTVSPTEEPQTPTTTPTSLLSTPTPTETPTALMPSATESPTEFVVSETVLPSLTPTPTITPTLPGPSVKASLTALKF
jgi:hypothetical protein